MKEVVYEDVVFKVGTTARENWTLIDEEDQDYYWFHLSSFASCHVICCSNILTPSLLQKGSELCKMNTKYRSIPKIRVNYTPLSNIKKGEKEGSVYFGSNRKVKNIVV